MIQIGLLDFKRRKFYIDNSSLILEMILKPEIPGLKVMLSLGPHL